MAFMSIKNLTVGVRDGDGIKIDFINNKLTGYMGKIFDRLLVHKNRRDCILKSIEFFQHDHDTVKNETFSQLAKNNLADVYYLQAENKYTFEHLESTKTNSIAENKLGQFLLKPTKYQQTDLTSFLFTNIKLLLFILIGYCLIGLFYFIFTKLIDCKKIEILNIKLHNLLSLNYSQLCFLSFKLGLLKLFFNLFLFINLVLLTNTIKTDKVIVKTDEFLNTEYKLFETNKKFAFIDFDGDIYRLSPKTSLLGKLYQKKVHLEKNFFTVSPETPKKEYDLILEKLTSFFTIGNNFANLYCFGLLSKYSKGKEFLYLNDQSYFEIPLSHYLRKSLNEDTKRIIHQSTNQFFENGIFLEFDTKLENEIYKLINNNNVPIIFNLNDYIEQQFVVNKL